MNRPSDSIIPKDYMWPDNFTAEDKKAFTDCMAEQPPEVREQIMEVQKTVRKANAQA